MSPFQIVLVCYFGLELLGRLFLTGQAKEYKFTPFGLLAAAFMVAGCVVWL